MGGFAQICREFYELGGDTDTGLKAPNGVNFNDLKVSPPSQKFL